MSRRWQPGALVAASLVSLPAFSATEPRTSEEALAMSRALLAQCEKSIARHKQFSSCVKTCTRAVSQLEQGGGLPFTMHYENCSRSHQIAEQVFAQEPSGKPLLPPAPAVSAPVTAQAASAWQPAAALDRSGLRLDGAIDWNGYEVPGVMYAVFTGDFAPYRDGAFSVELLLHLYVSMFEARCEPFLPPDSVLVVNTHTKRYRNMYNAGYDIVTKSQIRIAPKFLEGYQGYDATRNAYNTTGGLGNPNAARQVFGVMDGWMKTVDRFFNVEPCQGPAMLQLGENLARLTAGRAPLQSEPDAAQLLAGMRVKVDPALEERDRRAKKAEADAWWNAERPAWSQAPRVQSGTQKLIIDYPAVPPDYVIPVPMPAAGQILEINVAKPYGRRIHGIILRRGTVSSYSRADYTPEQNRIYDRYWGLLEKEGIYVLGCHYSALSSARVVHFWHRTAPKSLDVAALRAEWPKNPLLEVRAPRTTCPLVMP
jgi:hypothetical protein